MGGTKSGSCLGGGGGGGVGPDPVLPLGLRGVLVLDCCLLLCVKEELFVEGAVLLLDVLLLVLVCVSIGGNVQGEDVLFCGFSRKCVLSSSLATLCALVIIFWSSFSISSLSESKSEQETRGGGLSVSSEV